MLFNQVAQYQSICDFKSFRLKNMHKPLILQQISTKIVNFVDAKETEYLIILKNLDARYPFKNHVQQQHQTVSPSIPCTQEKHLPMNRHITYLNIC